MSTNDDFLAACKKGNFEEVEKLLKKFFFKPDVNVQAKNLDYAGETALHIASIKGYKDIAELLIKKGVDIDIKNEKKYTPLYMALDQDQYEIAEMLINNGANLNCIDNDDNSSLHKAVFKRKKDIIELLLNKGADVNAKDFTERSVLHSAVSYAGKEIVELLIRNGADVNAKEEDGYSVLHFAYRKGEDMIELLLKEGAYINAKDNVGNTVLHWAAKNECTEEVKILVKWGASLNIRNNSGETPLDLAKDKGNKEIIQLLSKGTIAVSPLAAIVIVFNRDFASAGQFAQEILVNLTTRGKTYKTWMQNDTPIIIKFHQNAQDQMTAASIATVEFRKLFGQKVEPRNIQFGIFEGSKGIFGSVLSYWR